MRLARDQTISVELELEEPTVASERGLGGFTVHHFDGFRVDPAAHRFLFRFERFPDLRTRALARLYLFDGETREHRLFRKGIPLPRRLHPGIPLLDHKPVFLALLYLHQRPLSVELVALELEQKLPLLQSLAPILEW